MFLNRVDCARYGTILVKMHNDYATEQRDVYPNDRISAFSLVNNPNLNGASFAQDGTKSTEGISCWGCERVGVTLAQCTNANCVKANKIEINQHMIRVSNTSI
jgi:hypothetical protein